MKFSLKNIVLFSLRYPFDNYQALSQAILYSAAGLVVIQLLIMLLISLIQGMPFNDFAVKSDSLGSLYATSMPLSSILLVPLFVAIILHLFKGKTFQENFVSVDMGMQSAWCLLALAIYVLIFAVPQLIYHLISTYFPEAEFMIYILLGLPAIAASIFFMLTLVFLPLRTVLGEKINLMANIELTKNHLFIIFLVILTIVAAVAVRIPIHILFSLIFSALPAIFNIIISTLALTLLDIFLVLILTAALCHLYADISGKKLKTL